MGDGLLEFDGEDLGEWRDGERSEDGDEDEDELVENDDGFPFVGPILEIMGLVFTRSKSEMVAALPVDRLRYS